MYTLPAKNSQSWFYIWAVTFVGNTLLLIISRALLNQEITAQNILGFSIVSFLITLFVLPGYFGWRLLSFGVLLGNIVGLIYLFYLILTVKNDGWIDLTSIFAFLSVVVIGLITGILAQIVIPLTKRK